MTLQVTDLSVSPFFDDFNEDKNFHRVLFRPTRSVQARELNQAQTIIQEQVNRLGRHLFEEGAMVIPGGISTEMNQSVIKVSYVGGTSYDAIKNRTEDLFIKSKSNNMNSKVMFHWPVEGAESAGFMINYLNSGDDNVSKTFDVDEACSVYYIQDGVEVPLANVNVTSTHQGVWVKVLSGVYFVRGHLVKTEDQSIVVSKYTNEITRSVGFKVSEQIISEDDDNSLYSNAIGSENFKAPGASRLKISLSLALKNPTDPNDISFVEIVKFENGVLQKKVDSTAYAFIENTLAQRTFEESGDYVVDKYPVEVLEHIRDTDHPDGTTSASLGGLESNYVARVKPGVGYVKGFRIQNIGLVDVVQSKARDTQFVNNSVVPGEFGQYLLVQNMASLPDMDPKKTFTAYAADGSTAVGSLKIRGIKKDGSYWRLYVFGVTINAGKTIADFKKVKFSDASNLFSCDLVQSVMFDTSKSSMVFKLPYDAVKTMRNNGLSDTTYTVMRSYDLLTNSSGVATVSLAGSEIFNSVNAYDWFVGLTGAANPGTLFDPTTTITLSGSPTGKIATINLGVGQASKNIKLVAPIIKTAPYEKTKTITSNTENLVFTGVAFKTLAKADIYKLVSVTDTGTGADLLSSFTFWDGQQPSWYECGQLKTIDGKTITRNVTVTYQYFEHSPGDFFSVDSYGGLARTSIPTTTCTNDKKQYSLADCLDFRPLRDASGNITSATYQGDLLKTGENIRFDLFYYLNRYDSLYVDSTGKFGIVSGISADSPTPPKVPANSMRLYNLFVPAYTAKASDVKVVEIDNRRYTMRDIGALEKRIQNLEYYTTLSMAEAAVNKTQILDPVTGNSRFKNGFVVDGFNDLRLADILDPEWDATIDFDRGVLVAARSYNAVDLTVASAVNARINETITKAQTDVVAVDQPYATRWSNINPYAVFTWVGSVSLTPSSDFWIDTYYNPPIIQNLTVDLTGGARAGTTVSTSVFGATTTTTTRTTTISSSVSTTSSDVVVSQVIIPYMRGITIRFKLENFRPFTTLYPFWDGVSVQSQVQQDGKALGDPVITDAAGKATGSYFVPTSPTLRFRTGSSIFRWTDSPTDSRIDGEFTTDGQAVFRSGGDAVTRQVTITNTRTLRASTSTSVRSVTRDTGRQGKDPIAQSFVVNEDGGAFLSKIDIFFKTKAVAVPVTLQVRTMENGLPTGEVLPFGEVNLYPDQVNVSADASVATSFVFPEPLFVEQGVEYAIVLLADTQEYNCYIARMGENVIGKQISVAKQPNIGVFFSSSNGSTWTPHQLEDLTFKVWRNTFNAADTVTTFNGGTAIPVRPMDYNSLYATSGSKTVVATLRSHGLKVGDKVTLAGFVDGNGLLATNVNAQQTVTAATVDTFTFTLTGGSNATTTGSFGGSSGTAVCNMPLTSFYLNSSQLVLPNDTLTWEYSYLQNQSRSMTSWAQFDPNTVVTLPVEGIVTKPADIQFRATKKCGAAHHTPMLDTVGLTAAVYGNRLNNDVNAPVFKYVTKSVRFDNPSTSARFYVSAKLPGDSTMKLYYKPIVTGDEVLSNAAWVELSPTKPLTNSAKDFYEYEYQLSGIGSFVGYKVKVAFIGSDPANPPEMADFRSIALA